MSWRDNISQEDIIRVNEVRNHPKYEPGFEVEVTENERVWDNTTLEDTYRRQMRYNAWLRQQGNRQRR